MNDSYIQINGDYPSNGVNSNVAYRDIEIFDYALERGEIDYYYNKYPKITDFNPVFELDFTSNIPSTVTINKPGDISHGTTIDVINTDVTGILAHNSTEQALELPANNYSYLNMDISSIYSGGDFTIEFECKMSLLGILWNIGNPASSGVDVNNKAIGVNFSNQSSTEGQYHQWDQHYNQYTGDTYTNIKNFSASGYKNIIFTYDGTTVTKGNDYDFVSDKSLLRKNIYVDGVYITPSSQSGNDAKVEFINEILSIGNRSLRFEGLSTTTEGYIRNVRFYNTCFSKNEVMELYQSRL